jgi:hypothetical protein
MTHGPPSLASWLLSRTIASGRQEELLGDLEELFQVHALDRGRSCARRWYWRQALHALVDAVRSRRRHLREQGLIETVPIGDHHQGVVLSDRGLSLLDANRRERDSGEDGQEFHAGVSRFREIEHDSSLYEAYRAEEVRIRDEHPEADIRRQELLQAHNRDRPDSDGRPDQDAREIEQWARDHELPYFDDQVHFPDFRIEYEVDGRERHEDVEVLTPHYRGAHMASRARCGFRRYSAGGSGRCGGRVNARLAEDMLP